ncbi:hypothetical protein SSIG_07274 [Streptomyces filamentosus NRRL 11379]|nr:hypothetical protein SSIG_07274 [Streptomyces filamentosus NRRL 11379]
MPPDHVFGKCCSHARARGVGRSPHGPGESRKYPACETAYTVTFPATSPQVPACLSGGFPGPAPVAPSVYVLPQLMRFRSANRSRTAFGNAWTPWA